ncbi:MAG: hypothetical protein IPK57_15055 [Chitinophagaceae bacterium]|nr:hypothetical protein [Chitinophagaceae bacterium]
MKNFDPYLQRVKDNSGKMMESMSDIVWAINPADDSLESTVIRMKEFAAEMLEPARINYYFDTEGSFGPIPAEPGAAEEIPYMML